MVLVREARRYGAENGGKGRSEADVVFRGRATGQSLARSWSGAKNAASDCCCCCWGCWRGRERCVGGVPLASRCSRLQFSGESKQSWEMPGRGGLVAQLASRSAHSCAAANEPAGGR